MDKVPVQNIRGDPYLARKINEIVDFVSALEGLETLPPLQHDFGPHGLSIWLADRERTPSLAADAATAPDDLFSFPVMAVAGPPTWAPLAGEYPVQIDAAATLWWWSGSAWVAISGGGGGGGAPLTVEEYDGAPTVANVTKMRFKETDGYVVSAGAAGEVILGFRLTSTIPADSKVIFVAPTTSYASINLPPGTAPTAPANGDLWVTSTGLFTRVNGVTYNLLTPNIGPGTTYRLARWLTSTTLGDGLIEDDGNVWTTMLKRLAFRGGAALAPSGDQNDYAVGDAVAVEINPTTAINITGFSGGSATMGDKRLLILYVLGNTVTLRHNSTSSAIGNRIYCPGAKDLVLTDTSGAILVHTSSSGVWRVVGVGQPTSGRLVGTTVLTSNSSTTYNKPANVNALRIRMVGGGGGGAGSEGGSGGSASGGGGAGGYLEAHITSPLSSYTYQCGAAGAAGAVGAGGTAGGDTTFGSLTATGGSGGSLMPNGTGQTNSGTGPGGVGSGGDLNLRGSTGTRGFRWAGGAASPNIVLGGNGGAGPFGSPGLGGTGQNAGSSASSAPAGYGAGGGGGTTTTATGTAGGGGSPGLIIVQEFT